MRLSFRSMGLAALLASAVTVPALAQQPTSSTYPTCPGSVSSADSEAAHGLYVAGKRSFDEADYPTAISLFKDAYKRDCTKHELLNIIARSYELKGDRAEAINALETYVKRGKLSDSDSDAIQKRIANLKQQLAQQPVAAASAPPTATAPTATTTTTAPPPPPPPPAEERHHGVAPWIVVGAGAAMAVTGVVLVVVGLNKIGQSRDLCPGSGSDRLCPDQSATGGPTSDQNRQTATDLQSQGNTFGAIGGVVGGVGVLAVAGGLVWHFVEPTGPEHPATGFGVRPEVAPGYAGASLGARF